MKKLCLMMAICLVVLECGSVSLEDMSRGWIISAPKNQPLEVKIMNDPNQDMEARINKLEAQVEHLEGWAVKVGGKFK